MIGHIEQVGVVLLVEHYEACAHFYREVIGLKVKADLGDLTVFQFGSGYLAVEQEGVAVAGGKSPAQDPVNLRFNVADVETEAGRIRAHGIAVDVSTHEWGTIGKFLDPDGNRCELRSHFDGFFAPLA